jgi:hypothetical protein
MKTQLTTHLLFLVLSTLSLHAPAQNLEWAKRMGGVSEDRGHSIVVDETGNVYTIGIFEGTVDFDPGPGIFNLTSAGWTDIFVSKVDPDGNFIWAKKLGGTNFDYGYSIALDGIGNVYTTGVFQGTADFDPGSGTFNLTSAGSTDVFISKLDPSGNFEWAKKLGGTSAEMGNSITVDSNSNVYLTGWFSETVDFDPGSGIFNLTSAGGSDIFIIKLNDVGNFDWAKQLGGTGLDEGLSVAVDGSGHVYTTGFFNGTADFDPGPDSSNLTSLGNTDVFISKLDASGNFVWAVQQGGEDEDRGDEIAVDGSGQLYILGIFEGTINFTSESNLVNLISAGDFDIFISKLDASGNFLWAKQMGGTSADRGLSIALDDDGNLHTTGRFEGTADFDPGIDTYQLTSVGDADIFISKLDASGNFMWAERFGGVSYDNGSGITVDGNGNVYTTGTFNGIVDFDPGPIIFDLTSAGDRDIFVHKMSHITTGINDSDNISVAIYPNPAIHYLNVVLEKEAAIEIYSITGVLIDAFSAKQNHRIDVTSYPAGMFFVNLIENEKKIATKKVIITR